MIKEKIGLLIENLPHLPGVYLMHNVEGEIIYIGKAIDLYKRVSQYFLRPQVGKVARMVLEADYFETIICQNEKEALVLEMNLIQTHYPKFNILLKDDSHYPYIAFKNVKDPYLTILRKKQKGFDCFGPYPSSQDARKMLELLNKVFPLRKCKNIPSHPCLYYSMHCCLAPCIHSIEDEEYQKIKKDIKSFLDGDNKKYINEFKTRMNKASEVLDYEKAKEYRDLLKAIKHINDSQNVEIDSKNDVDIFAYSFLEGYLSLTCLLYKKGKLLGKQSKVLPIFGDETSFLIDVITMFYHNNPLPKEIIINNSEVNDALEKFLDVKSYSVSKGKYFELICSAKLNAENEIGNYFLTAKVNEEKIELLDQLAVILNIKTPYRIVLFDNSHLQGTSPVGALVYFINGEPIKKLYRKFHLTTLNTKDDVTSMKEVSGRYFERLKKDDLQLPDLVLVDGGLLQVEAVKQVIEELNLPIFVAGLYKNDKHQTTGLITSNGQKHEFQNNKKLLFFLTRMQDEVHRFAIAFHRNDRNKKMKESIFSNIEGLGDKRIDILKKAYPNIDSLKSASEDDLAQIIPKNIANRLFNKLHDIT